jgi:hypothetical protein
MGGVLQLADKLLLQQSPPTEQQGGAAASSSTGTAGTFRGAAAH